jgi:hypothetical protein
MSKKQLFVVGLIAFVVMSIPYILYFSQFAGYLSTNDENWANFGSFIGGIVSSLFSFISFLAVLYTLLVEKQKKYIEIHIEYLKHMDTFNFEINYVLNTIVNIDKYSNQLLGNSIYAPLSIGPINDYFMMSLKIDTLRAYLNSTSTAYQSHLNKRKLFEIIMKDISEILNPDLFINICGKFEHNACTYFYMIDKNLREEYKTIIKKIQFTSQNNMQGFDIQDFKKMLVNHIFSINDIILNKKLDRTKDLFDN